MGEGRGDGGRLMAADVVLVAVGRCRYCCFLLFLLLLLLLLLLRLFLFVVVAAVVVAVWSFLCGCLSEFWRQS